MKTIRTIARAAALTIKWTILTSLALTLLAYAAMNLYVLSIVVHLN